MGALHEGVALGHGGVVLVSFVPFCMSISAIREGERLKVSTAGPTTCLFLSGFIGLLVCFIASLIYLFVCGLRFTC